MESLSLLCARMLFKSISLSLSLFRILIHFKFIVSKSSVNNTANNYSIQQQYSQYTLPVMNGVNTQNSYLYEQPQIANNMPIPICPPMTSLVSPQRFPPTNVNQSSPVWPYNYETSNPPSNTRFPATTNSSLFTNYNHQPPSIHQQSPYSDWSNNNGWGQS